MLMSIGFLEPIVALSNNDCDIGPVPDSETTPINKSFSANDTTEDFGLLNSSYSSSVDTSIAHPTLKMVRRTW